jgi:hypothetical protein
VAFSKSNEIIVHENDPQRVVIVSGPTFGTIAGLLLLGAAVGAAGVISMRRNSHPDYSQSALAEELLGSDSRRDKALVARADRLIQRVRVISTRARNTAQFAGEIIAPRVQSAMSEARQAAAKTEKELQQELDVD